MTHEPHSLLLVDDEDGIRNVLGITLGHAGYGVRQAGDGERALEIFREHRPDIVISDIKMPGMDGIDLLREIKSLAPETEVIMITGHGDMELAVKSLQHEASDFITKPIDSRELELSVEKAVDRIAINRQIRQYMGELEQTVQDQDRTIGEARAMVTIGQTVAAMSHVIKNIAGGLKGSSFILEQGIESENREYLVKGWEMMKGNIDKITRLSMDLLNYAKTGQLRFEPVTVGTLIEDVAGLLENRFESQGVAWICEMDWDVAAGRVQADKEALGACLVNLVENGLDALAGQDISDPRVQVTLLQAEQDIEIHIRDNGPGIPEGIRDRIFKEFITTKGSRGTGFGLMTANKIVNEHKGRLRFESAMGEGTEFVLFLPIHGDAGPQK